MGKLRLYRHKFISTQSYIDTKLYRHKFISTQSYIDTKLYRHKVIWTQSYIDTKLYRHKVISTQLKRLNYNRGTLPNVKPSLRINRFQGESPLKRRVTLPRVLAYVIRRLQVVHICNLCSTISVHIPQWLEYLTGHPPSPKS